MAIKNVALIGAGGNLGPAILKGLTTSPHNYNVSVLSRQESSYKAPEGVTLIKTDYSPASLVSALKGQDAVVSAITTTAVLEQKKIIDAAIAAGVKRFVPSEYGCDTSNPVTLERVPPLNFKNQIREYLESKQDQIAWTAIYTGPFFDWGLKVGFLGYNIPEASATLFSAYKDVPFSTSTLEFIGRAIAQALSPSIAPKTANQRLRVRSFTTTQTQILAALEKASGKKWTVQETDLDARVKDAQDKLAKSDFSGVGTLITGAVVDPKAGNNFDYNPSNDLLELPTEDINAVVKSVL
ncbi:hypothetical protein Plec18167_004855 [Paecilomyces lecythidis]|uniref:NmrA-like domain-containing protein n=1 Tax=Paecilomyces lecythidis TaxID=3004212 RepID=A0ABR3XNT0_9EURO